MKALFPQFLAILAVVAVAHSEPVSVSVDELLAHPSDYHGRTVRVSGIWDCGFEWSVLRPEADSRQMIWFEAEDQDVEHPKDPKLMLVQQLLHMRAPHTSPVPVIKVQDIEIEVEAQFEDWESLPSTRELKKEAAREGKEIALGAFGHMGVYKQRLIVSRVVSFRCLIEATDGRFREKKKGEPGATDNPEDAQR